MAGSKPAALPLGYTPAFIVARRSARRSGRGRSVPVVDRETQVDLAVRELDAPWDEQPRLGAGLRGRELIARERDSPEPLFERGERAVVLELGRRLERGIGQTEQPRVQAANRQPPTEQLRELRLGVLEHARVAARRHLERARRAVHLEDARAERAANREVERVGALLPAEPALERVVAGLDREPAAHLPRADRLEARAPLLVAQPVVADGQMRARREQRGGQGCAGERREPARHGWSRPLSSLRWRSSGLRSSAVRSSSSAW